jgi:hypothetical protein
VRFRVHRGGDGPPYRDVTIFYPPGAVPDPPVTVTDAEAVFAPTDAWMDVEPAPTPRTDADVPLPDTVATPNELLVHVMFARSAAVPPVTWALSVTEPPIAI